MPVTVQPIVAVRVIAAMSEIVEIVRAIARTQGHAIGPAAVIVLALVIVPRVVVTAPRVEATVPRLRTAAAAEPLPTAVVAATAVVP